MTNNSATEAAAGKADIVERLNDPFRFTHFYSGITYDHPDPIRAEAATEIASLRERVKELEAEDERDDFNMMTNLDAAIARAETAERKLAKAMEALKTSLLRAPLPRGG